LRDFGGGAAFDFAAAAGLPFLPCGLTSSAA
jgi:hypothetical protein